MNDYQIKIKKIKNDRLGEEKINKQGCMMRIVAYYNANNIVVELEDCKHTRVHTTYQNFKNLEVKSPYFPSVYGVGITGAKYPAKINGKITKEYGAWKRMLERCYSEKLKMKRPTYEDAICCDEWLLFENFYEWLHNQPNFDKWYNGEKWGLDKDIIIKGNKVYSPETCCLVPLNVNSLFTKHDNARGAYPIGISKDKNMLKVACRNPFNDENQYLGEYSITRQAFQVYKRYKEKIIKQVAQEEYSKGNITKQCYEAMMKYEVEITD